LKTKDKLRLSVLEFHYDKKEWLISVTLQTLVYICILFLTTIAIDIDRVFTTYLDKFYNDGYSCSLEGYENQDTAKLKEMGFYDFIIEDGKVERATLNSSRNLLIKKFQSIISGKDIYCADIEDDLSVMLFSIIVFAFLSIILFFLMCGNLHNALTSKLSKRHKYITMLIKLGMSKKECSRIYLRFFMLRNVLALIMAVGINVIMISRISKYFQTIIGKTSNFSAFNPGLILCLTLISLWFIKIESYRYWRGYKDE